MNSDERFDLAMRGLHDRALQCLPAPVRSRARVAAARRAPARVRPGWALATGIAALCAVALTLQLQPGPAPAPAVPAADPGLLVAAAPTAASALDETPDFYLWLASGDAVAVAVVE